MVKAHRNQSSQKFWDEVFLERYPKCLAAFAADKGEQFCFHLAADSADLALAERRRSAQADK